MICPGRVLLVGIQFALLIGAGINIYERGRELVSGSPNGDACMLVLPSIIFVGLFTKWFILPLATKAQTPEKSRL
ncbi:hypothetical protein Cantr_01160 [Candida viswanathii]|uniref:Uncharacterized protein n=1 Tax=Candida viswanathii TaxID=5486 RepID=A0A367YIB5_9ASCO|nr:hypothetical protein Cantr_01165 [Candida viswanathii]RCK65623.1 hypothetical protein Cantr_01160 [Candida viswanathii]